MYNLNFYKNKKILITGHTGFKGSWLTKILLLAGAEVCGYSLEPNTNPNLFSLLRLKDEKNLKSVLGDVRDREKLLSIFNSFKPEIVFHLAAQPLVRESYLDPVNTYETNVLGTLYVCEAIRQCGSVKSFVNITTDKVYENNDVLNHKFKENEKLDGYDPYSNSKSCSELLTHSYIKCFFTNLNIPTSTARAGNVIGGGDFSKDRIIPDCVKSILQNKELIIRNPKSIRPYQHVFDALGMYLLIAEKQYYNPCFSGSFNIGPDENDILNNMELISLFNNYLQNHFSFEIRSDNGPHEASFLSLDNSLIKKVFDWKPLIDINKAVELTAEWYQGFIDCKDMIAISESQIRKYFEV